MALPAAVVVRPHSMGDCCMVAPAPEIRRSLVDRYNAIKGTTQDSDELSFLESVLHPMKARKPGLNDGVVHPGTTPAKRKAREVVNVLVVMVEFSDVKFDKEKESKGHYHRLWFRTDPEKGYSVQNYFKDVSNHKVDIKGEVVGPYQLSKPISYYAHGASGIGKKSPNAKTMVGEVAEELAKDQKLDFKKYDNVKDDNKHYVDALVIVHAGSGAETANEQQRNAMIWSHKSALDKEVQTHDGTKLWAYLTVPADCKLGVCAHELGHLAFGWPDLYDIDYTSSGIGKWCLMASGNFNGNQGDNPSSPCAWLKVDQGWVNVKIPKKPEHVKLVDVKDGHEVLKLWRGGAPGREYFLVENRQKKGRDAGIPARGLLVWHIDETIKDNTSELTDYRVALIQSDGKEHLERMDGNQGDGGDPFPGRTNVRSINDNTNPSTRANNNTPSGVSISDISDPKDVMTFNVTV